MASNRGSILARFRWWGTRRRINRTLREAVWPVDPEFFKGKVLVSETVYPPGTRMIRAIEVTDEFDL